MSLLLAAGVSTPVGIAAILEDAEVVNGVGTDSVFGTAAVLEGADVIAGIGTDSVFGLAAILEGADVAAGVGTDSVSGIAAVFEDSEIVAASGTGVGVVAGPAEVPAGRKLRQTIYRLSVDGKVFHFGTMAGALAFLDKAKALALLAVQAQTRLATNLKAVRQRPAAPVIRTDTPHLRGAVLESNAAIKDAFDAAWRDAEIGLRIRIIERKRNDEDAEDMLWILATGDDLITISADYSPAGTNDDDVLWLM